jgi:hypothetical protein
MYLTGWVPSSCTGQAGCPVHVLDRPGAQVMYWTGWLPWSCIGQAECPVIYWTGWVPGHVLDRLGSKVMYCAAKALFSCPAIISQRPESRIISKEPLENTEEELKII